MVLRTPAFSSSVSSAAIAVSPVMDSPVVSSSVGLSPLDDANGRDVMRTGTQRSKRQRSQPSHEHTPEGRFPSVDKRQRRNKVRSFDKSVGERRLHMSYFVYLSSVCT